ncbi:MAG: RDD family protein [Candidatus Omnitrophica bacterium]|nr:RDD family protein [Candidatus Omnitrophota bacterium]
MEENLDLNVFDDEFVRLGGFWERFAAYFIDGIILGVASVILNFIPILGQILYFLLAILYFPYFYGTTGQTPGKKILGLKVVRLDGLDLTYGKGFLRGLLGYFISGLIFYIGYLMIGWDKKKQGLHDKISGTTVVAKEKKHTVLGIVLFLISFILPIILAITVIIPNFIRARNIAMQKTAQTSSQMPSEKYSSFPEAKEEEELPIFQKDIEDTSSESEEVSIYEKQKDESAKDAALQAIAEIEEKVAKIKSYRMDFKSTAFHPDGAKVEKEGYEICILPAKIKVDTAIKVDSSTQRFIAVSDGKKFWQSNPIEKIAYAIDLTKLTPQAKEKVLATAMPAINIDITELKTAIINDSGKLKAIENLGEEKSLYLNNLKRT